MSRPRPTRRNRDLLRPLSAAALVAVRGGSARLNGSILMYDVFAGEAALPAVALIACNDTLD